MKGCLSSPRILVSLVILGLISAFLVACSTSTSPAPFPSPNATAAPTIAETLIVTTATPTSSVPSLRLLQTATPAESGDSTGAAIASAMRRIQQAGPFRVRSVTTTQTGKSLTLTGEVILPDHFHILTPDTEILIDGQQTFTRNNGSWVRSDPNDLGSLISGLMGNFSEQAIQGISNARFIHAEILNGIPTHEYRYQSDVNLGGEIFTTDNLLWIDDQSGLPIRLESTGQVGGAQATTVQDISYDPSITIESPNP